MLNLGNLQRARCLPVGFLGTLVLIAVVERTLFHNKASFTSTQAASWKYVDHYAPKHVRGKDLLCFGDSLIKFSVLPSVLKEQSGLSAYNLGMFAGPTPASYFAFRRALESGARPSAVLIDCAAGILSEGPASRVRPYPWADLLGIGEAVELAWSARDPDLLASTALALCLPSMKSRHEIRGHIRKAFSGKQNHQPMILAIAQRNWNKNDGAQAQANVEFDDHRPPEGNPASPSWQCNPVNELYLRRFCSLAAQHQIPVYWLLPPYSPGEQAHQEHRGERRLYNQFVRTIQSRYENVVVIDARNSGYDTSFFFDHAHLNCDGAIATTVGIAEILTQSSGGESASRRWISLPRARTIPSDVEDSTQSIAAVKAMAKAARR